jgi:hypothetical protein
VAPPWPALKFWVASDPFTAIFEKRLIIIYIYTNNATLRYHTEALLFFFTLTILFV